MDDKNSNINNELLYDPLYKTQDYDLWARAFKKFKLANIVECSLCYRLHEKQMNETEEMDIFNDTKHLVT